MKILLQGFLLLMIPFLKINLKYSTLILNYMILETEVNIYMFMFLLSLTVIFLNIMYFKIMYMMESKMIVYFNILMLLFFTSMMILIISSSYISLLIGWEGLGLTSYLLVMYYMNWNSVQGSYLTMITNRFGDAFLMMFLMMYGMNLSVACLIIITFMSLTKSAQAPFMSWLPAAMAAPTPVSALVHSSTLVTAGILLFFKFNMPISMLMIKEYLIMFGVMTMLSGSISALLSNDVKKIVAFSTLSQLGFMLLTFYSLWLGLVLYHLLVHAFLKSFMFILVGLMILKMFSQSVFNICYPIYSYSSISLFMMIFLSFCNMWFSMMFFSKEISNLYMESNMLGMKLIYFLTMVITLVYMLRLYFMFNILTSNKINIINKFHMTKLNLNYWFMMIMMGFCWFINMIKFKFNLVMWNLLMMLILLWIYMKLSFLNLFNLFSVINNFFNKIKFKLLIFYSEESFLLNTLYNSTYFKMSLLNWGMLMNLMMFILIYLNYIEFLIQQSSNL